MRGQLCGATKVILIDTLLNDGNNYVLDFDEEFLGTTLDLGKWEIQQWSQGSFDGTGAYYTLDNVEIHPETIKGEATSATGVCRVIAKKKLLPNPLCIGTLTVLCLIINILLHKFGRKKNSVGECMKYVAGFRRVSACGLPFGCMAMMVCMVMK